MITRRDLLAVSAAGVAFSAAGLVRRAVAQAPAKSVHILTGFTPGLQDALARLIAGQMNGYAETIVVEASAGRSGRVAVEAVKTATPTERSCCSRRSASMMLFPHVYKALRYAPRDFTPVSTVASTPTLLTVGPKVPGDVRTLVDFVSWCRANPKRPPTARRVPGPRCFLGACWGARRASSFFTCPYQGNGSIQDLLKGEIASTVMPISSSLASSDPEIYARWRPPDPAAARFFPLCQRWRKPDIPRLKTSHGMGFFVPAKTPANIVEKLNTAIQAALHTDEVKSGMARMAVEPDARRWVILPG